VSTSVNWRGVEWCAGKEGVGKGLGKQGNILACLFGSWTRGPNFHARYLRGLIGPTSASGCADILLPIGGTARPFTVRH